MVQTEQVKGLLRHFLTFIGGILVAKGLATEGQIMDIIGMIITFVGTIWSVISKKV
jgi:hypothetical protein